MEEEIAKYYNTIIGRDYYSIFVSDTTSGTKSKERVNEESEYQKILEQLNKINRNDLIESLEKDLNNVAKKLKDVRYLQNLGTNDKNFDTGSIERIEEIKQLLSDTKNMINKTIDEIQKKNNPSEKELKALEWSLLEREVNLAVRQKEIKKMTKAIEEKREINVSEREKACAEKEAWKRELTAKVTQLDEKPLEGKND